MLAQSRIEKAHPGRLSDPPGVGGTGTLCDLMRDKWSPLMTDHGFVVAKENAQKVALDSPDVALLSNMTSEAISTFTFSTWKRDVGGMVVFRHGRQGISLAAS